MTPKRVLAFSMVLVALSAVVLFVRLSGAGADAIAAASEEGDRSLSPYFVVEGAEPGVEALPLESTRAKVQIAGVIADVTVTQTYRNEGDTPISARYVFPASTRAAVYGMRMRIGDRLIVARIKERDEARAEYEQAKAEGKTASLLEQDRPNLFSMQVANVMPGDRIDVELRYTELLVSTDGAYELVYPTVVGPRYVSPRADAADAAAAVAPYRHAGEPADYDFGLDLELAAGMPIQSIHSPSHHITTRYGAQRDTASVGLAAGEDRAGTRDFVLRYRLAGDDLASGLLLHRGADESFFLMMVQPPARPAPEQIPDREYVFIVDVSGSMMGFPLETSKALMRDLLGRLRPNDRFNVLLFAGDSRLYAERSVPASADELDRAIAFLDAQSGGGGTELGAALERAMALPADANASRSFVVVTDGYIAEEPATFELVRAHLGEANVFAFGIGTSVNRHLIEGLARVGQGEPFVVESDLRAKAEASRFRAYIEQPVLTNVRVAFRGFDAYDVTPVAQPDVLANRPIVVFGKWRGEPTGEIELSGVSGRGRFVNTLRVGEVAPSPTHAALAQLWARARITDLSDYYQGDTNRDEVVRLGLRYNLLTRFTSFIAVHQVVRNGAGSIDVDQPLPMPDGVSDAAIDYAAGPEPSLWLALALALGALAFPARRRRHA